MDKSMQMKHEVLEMLKNFMMGEEGKRIKPKAISVEMITDKPAGSLKDVLDEASEDAEDMDDMAMEEGSADKMADKMNAAKAGMSEQDWEGSEGDEEADEKMEKKNPRMSLKEFLASK